MFPFKQSDFVADAWHEALNLASLGTFDALWNLDAPWFEEPNQRRGGWSGVARIEVERDGRRVGFFLKRQEDHLRYSLFHPLGEPTFKAEFRNIRALESALVPSLEAVYYGERRVDGHRRAILITRELAGFQPLHLLSRDWFEGDRHASRWVRRSLIGPAAAVVRRLHRAGLVHNALHPKHLFVRLEAGAPPEVRLIDLEKMRRARSERAALLRDLDSLNRRTRFWSRTDRLRFLRAYLGTSRLDDSGRAIWRELARRAKAAGERGG